MAHTRMTVLITEVNEGEEQHLTAQLGELCTLLMTPLTLNEMDLTTVGGVEIVLPFIHSHIGRAEFEAMPNLKCIATRSTGYDHIDLALAAEKGVVVCNVPSYGENTVAEHTFGLILTLSRKIHTAYLRTQRGDYSLEGLRGFDLYDKTLGVVGAGSIGLHVIRIARGFGMHVLAYDVRPNRLLSEVLGFHYVGLDQLLSQADIVTLHAPALPVTFHMMNRESLAKMKRGALLINTARGSLVDTEALAHALDRGELGGAGLDALEGEEFLHNEEDLLTGPGNEAKLKTLLRNHILQRRDNVVITPHIAFNSEEALLRILDTTIENVRSFVAGTPQNLVKVV